MDTTQQSEVDKKMLDLDGTADKSKLGANAILGVSMAVCRVCLSVWLPGMKCHNRKLKQDQTPLWLLAGRRRGQSASLVPAHCKHSWQL